MFRAERLVSTTPLLTPEQDVESVQIQVRVALYHGRYTTV